VFDARNFFDPGPVPSFRRNQFGLALGGPILKDKTFFFLNYEGFRQSLGTTLIDVVPSLSARQGPVDPKVAPYLGLYNLPNSNVTGNTGNFVFTTQQPTNEDFATLHLDHNFSSKDTLHATGLFDKSDSTSADNSDAVIDLAITRRWTGVLEEVHVFSPSLTNAARFGYSRSVASAPRQTGVINPAAADTRLGFVPGATPGALIVSGLTTFNGGPGAVGTNTFNYNAYQLYDDATLVRGTHSISFGGSVERDQDNERGGLLPFGEWNFGSVANFLANVPSFYEAGLPSTPVTPRYLRQTIAAGYVQDDWRIRKEFTLNLGLRYEMATNLSEARNRLSQLIHLTDPAPVQVNHFFANNPTLKNFEPRLGFAWDVGGRAKTVIRGAFGIYDVLPLSYLFELNTISAAPFYDEGRNTTVARGSFPNGAFAGTTPKLRQFYTQQNPGRTYVMQASFNVEEQLTPNTTMTVGYIGSHGVRQPFNANDMNIVLPVLKSPVGYVWPKAGTGVQTNPNVGSIVGTLFNGSSLYHSLQASLKYASNRMTAQLSYTWSHSIDDSSSSLGGASFGNSNANPPYFDVRLGRGSSDFDVRHVLTANTVIALPSPGKNRGFWAAPLRGWTFNNIITVRTGLPFTPTIGGDPLGLLSSAGGFGFPDIVPGVGSCTNGHNVNYLNTACFKFPGTYQYAPGLFGPILGNAGRNNISGPGIFNWTTGIQKDTVLTERVRLQLQAQAFNVTNHTNFAPPQSTQAQIFNAGGALLSTAGQLTLTTTTSRQLQFAVKFLF
ncbi:MAG: hypothetical protein JOZ62_17135, partial [Acidobacteriaceae bacterium]|nr:hypothetical protein [Acidobacteriaceae bacterium]